jgi:hypothetical protein
MFTDKEIYLAGLVAKKQEYLDKIDWLAEKITEAMGDTKPAPAKTRKPRRTKAQMEADRAEGKV